MDMYMTKNDLALLLSIVATGISILSFFKSTITEIWKTWNERTRLRFAASKVIQKNSDGKQFNQIEIKISNIGLRPITLTAFHAISDNSLYNMGDNDPTASLYGVILDVFPAHLKPGDTIKFYPMTIEALISNQTDPKDHKKHYSPWLYFTVLDSFDTYHYIDVQHVLKILHMMDTWHPKTQLEKIKDFFLRKRLFAKSKQINF